MRVTGVLVSFIMNPSLAALYVLRANGECGMPDASALP